MSICFEKLNRCFFKSFFLFAFIFLATKISATDLAPTGRIAPLVDQYLNDNISFSLKVSNLNVVTAFAAEWHVEVTVKNSLDAVVFTTTIDGVDLAPGKEVQVTATNTWTPSTADEYQVIYHVMYLYEINPSNDVDQYYFNVWSAPSPASIFFPENGATDVPFSPPPTLSAQSGSVPVTETKIDLTVAQPDSGKSFTKTTDSSKISLTPNENLKPGTMYEWTVTQTNPSGSTMNGPFTFTTQTANDLYPSSLMPDGEHIPFMTNVLPNCDICFKYDHPVKASEWKAKIDIVDSAGENVFTKLVDGIDGNGPNNCVPLPASIVVSDLSPGKYTLKVTTQYLFDMDKSNDSDSSGFIVDDPEPDKITDISPSDSSNNFPINGSLSWHNGNYPITSSTINLAPVPPEQGNSFMEMLPGTATSFMPSENLMPGTQYQWTLDQTNSTGTTMNGPFTFTTAAAVSVSEEALIPDHFKLYQNYPNPFNPTTLITYDVSEAVHVKLEIFNLIGQRIKTLVDKMQPQGRYNVEFKADDLPSGVYLYSIILGNYTSMRKMILMK